MVKEVFVPAHPFGDGWRDSYRYGRRGKVKPGLPTTTYFIDYYGHGKYSGQSSSGTLTILDNEIPLYVGDRDVNGRFGDYLRKVIANMLMHNGVNIPSYDIKLKMRYTSGGSAYGIGGYTRPKPTPLGRGESLDESPYR